MVSKSICLETQFRFNKKMVVIHEPANSVSGAALETCLSEFSQT